MLQVKDLGYASWETVYYQRATVLLTELVLVFALYLYDTGPSQVLKLLLTFNQLRPVFATWHEEAVSCCRNLHPTVSRPPDHRSHSLPIQWFPIRHSDSLHRTSEEKLGTSCQRHCLCSLTLLQAHLPLPGTCLLRLPPSRLLPWAAFNLSHPVPQLHQAWTQHHCCGWPCFRTFRLL